MNLDLLKEKWDKVTVSNVTTHARSFPLANHDSITIQAGASRVVLSKDLIQLPDTSVFEMTSPSIFELAAEGVLYIKGLTPPDKMPKDVASTALDDLEPAPASDAPPLSNPQDRMAAATNNPSPGVDKSAPPATRR